MSEKWTPPVISAFATAIQQQYLEAFKPLAEQIRPFGFAADGLNRALLPENLQPLHDQIRAGDALAIMRSEGIPLAPVPRAEVALDLLGAEDLAARRAILADRASEIAEDCRGVLAELRHGDQLADLVAYAVEGSAALVGGSPAAAQALFSVIVTTVVENLDLADDEAWKAAMRVKAGEAGRAELVDMPAAMDELAVWEFWVAAPLWHAFPSVDFRSGAQLPDRWSRHASIHDVSSVHYNLENAVIAMMFTTALLYFVGPSTADQEQ